MSYPQLTRYRTRCQLLLARLPGVYVHALYARLICVPYMCFTCMPYMHASCGSCKSAASGRLCTRLTCTPYVRALYACLICMPYVAAAKARLPGVYVHTLYARLICVPYMHALCGSYKSAASRRRRLRLLSWPLCAILLSDALLLRVCDSFL